MYTLEVDISDNYYAVHVKKNGVIIHTTNYYKRLSHAMDMAAFYLSRIS